MHLLDHQVFQVGQGVLQIIGLAAHEGRYVFKDGVLAQVKLDHVRHVGVDRLVVGHARAHRVANGHMPDFVGFHQARTTQRRGGTEHLGVQKIIVHPAVNHIHPLGAACGAHVNKLVLDEQVLTFDQLHPHLLRQKGVLEVGAVVHAGREYHHRGFGRGGGAAGAQSLQQQIGVVRDWGHAVLAEQLWEQPHHHLAVFQHVAHAAGHAQVVFEHVVLTIALGVGRTHDVDAADVRINVVGHIHTHHLGAKLGVVFDLLTGDHPSFEDVLVVVDVMDKAVEGRDALHQASLHAAPLLGGDHAGDQIEGDQPLGTPLVCVCVFVLVTVNGKGDAHAPENHLGFFAPCRHGLWGLRLQPSGIGLVMLSDFPVLPRNG